MIRLLLRRLLEKEKDWQVCGEASNGVEAIEWVERFKPDVVVMDLAMPVMNGLQAGPEIARGPPSASYVAYQRPGGLKAARMGSS